MPTRKHRGRPAHEDVLTPAEWRVVHAVQHGMTNREIAARRGISADAVKFHVANVYAKLGVTNRKALRQWFRAPRGSALSRREVQVSTPSRLGRIAQLSRTVKDLAQAQAWYRDVLGLAHLYSFPQLAFFDCGGTRLMLTQYGEPSATESILYLAVEDIVRTRDELIARGVEFINAPHMIHRHPDGTEEWLVMFKDPEGRPLGLISLVSPAKA